jgi:hypothetical protein
MVLLIVECLTSPPAPPLLTTNRLQIYIGIHTDSDYFASSLLYSRTFLHSYTLFMALQDTTSRMGATTVCPGTHWCANEDLSDICLPEQQQQQPQNKAFEVSSNGHTGRNTGLLYQGDGMMFNQNIWHRGPKNDDKQHIMNRVMFIVTFVSRQAATATALDDQGDVRQQGLGTYYYQRWNMWGHTLNDLKVAATRMTQPMAALKAMGIWKGPNTTWGVLWLEHFARQLANEEDFFAQHELPDFLRFLDSVRVPRWLQGRRQAIPKDNNNNKDRQRELELLLEEEEEELEWEPFLIRFATNIKELADTLFSLAFAWYMILNTIAIAVTQRGAGGFFKRTLLTFLVSAILWMGVWHYVTQVSYLGKRIQMRDTWRQPFSEPPASLDHLKRTTYPTRQDVLVGSRFDAPYLSSFNHVLDYHPGNLEFETALQAFGITMIQAYMSQPVQGVTPRFLQQDWQTGFWSLMTDDETKDYIARQVHANQYPWIGRLDEHLKIVLADARFGLGRETILARKLTPQLVMDWQSVLYRTVMAAPDATTPAATGTSPTTEPSTKTATIFPRYATIKTRLPTTIVSSLSPKTPSTLLIRNANGSLRLVRKGDRVMAPYFTSGQYWEATVGLGISDDMVAVDYALSGDMGNADVVPKDAIQPFTSLVQGDLAQVAYLDNEDDWRWVEILSIHPLGHATIQYSQDDEDEDEFIPEQDRIVRDLPLEDIRLPPSSSSSSSASWATSPLCVHVPSYQPEKFNQVQAQFGAGTGQWFRARIDQVHQDGTYAVSYHDGDFEEHVALHHIKPLGVSSGKQKQY